MKRLIYRSKASESVGANDVFAIVETSKKNNPRRDVTGFLLYDDDRFFQLIEGADKDIDGLMLILGKDKRHHSIEVLDTHEVSYRLFDNWDMKLLITFSGEPALAEIKRKVLERPESDKILDLVTDFIGVKRH